MYIVENKVIWRSLSAGYGHISALVNKIVSFQRSSVIKVYLVLLLLNPVENCVWAVYYRRRVVTES